MPRIRRFWNRLKRKEVFKENHIGIPFVHWMKKGSRFRYYYVFAMRLVTLGKNIPELNTKEWTESQLHYIDNFTFYRTHDEIMDAFSRFFDVKLIDEECFRLRLKYIHKTRWTDKIPFFHLLRPIIWNMRNTFLNGNLFILAKKPYEKL